MDVSLSIPGVDTMAMFSKRKREPLDYCEYYPSYTSFRKRRKSIADYERSSAQQQQMYRPLIDMPCQSLIDDTRFQQNSACSPLLRLPAEIRNEISSYVLSNQVVHISVRECPIDDNWSFSHAQYYRHQGVHKAKSKAEICTNSFLKFTHTLCTLPFDEEDRTFPGASCKPTALVSHSGIDAYTRATLRNRTVQSTSNPKEEQTSYRTRHKPCYHALARLKGNWIRDGEHVTVSPNFKQASRPGLSVPFLQTCRQIYTESRDLVYMSNTFAFHEGNTLDLFVSRCLSSHQRGLISSIQLDGWSGAEYDPGCRVRPTTWQLLTGLQSLHVAVTNAYLGSTLHALNFHSSGDSTSLGHKIEDSYLKKDGSRGEIVQVTVDRLENGSAEVLDLERLVKRNVEAALGYYRPF